MLMVIFTLALLIGAGLFIAAALTL